MAFSSYLIILMLSPPRAKLRKSMNNHTVLNAIKSLSNKLGIQSFPENEDKSFKEALREVRQAVFLTENRSEVPSDTRKNYLFTELILDKLEGFHALGRSLNEYEVISATAAIRLLGVTLLEPEDVLKLVQPETSLQ